MRNTFGNMAVLMGKGGIGATAQAMAAAPLSSTTDGGQDVAAAGAPEIELSAQERAEIEAQTPAVENGNPYDVLFGGLTFSTADSDQVYTNERNGSKSKRIGTFLAHVRGVAVSIPGTIYARLPKGSTKAYIDVAFVGTARQSALKPHDEESRLHLLAWKVRTANQFAAWRSAQNLGSVPQAATMMPSIDGINFQTDGASQ